MLLEKLNLTQEDNEKMMFWLFVGHCLMDIILLVLNSLGAKTIFVIPSSR
jgi:hypothetical protein